jgi:plastocyanin
MRRPLLAIALLAIALAAGACSASTAPGWTYAPPTPAPAVTPAPSGASAVPSAAPAEPTPVPGGPAASGGAAGGAAVEVSAVNVAYEQTEISAPAGAPFVIHFVNKDAGIPHNIEIKDSTAMSMFKGDIITGTAETSYQVPALAAGTYQFVCSVHPNMVGTLKVGG